MVSQDFAELSSAWRVRWATQSNVDGRVVASTVIGKTDVIACGDWSGRPVVVTAMDYAIEDEVNPHAVDAVHAWDATTFELLRTLPNLMVRELVVCGSLVVIRSWNDAVLLWDFATGETTPIDTPHGVSGLAMPAPGQIVIAGEDGVVRHGSRHWDTGDALTCLDPTGMIACGRLAHVDGRAMCIGEVGIALVSSTVLNGRFMVVTAHWDGTVHVWDGHTGEQLLPPARLSGKLDCLSKLAVIGDRLLVPTNFQVEVLDLASGQWLAPLRGVTSWAAVAARDDLVFTCATGKSGAGVLSRWELDRPHTPQQGHLGPVHAVAFVGGYVVTGGMEGAVRRWDAQDGTPAEPMTGHTGPVLALTGVDVAGKQIAVTGGGDVNGGPDETLRRWDLEALTQWAPPIVAGHAGQTQVLAARGRFVFSGGNGGRVSMWDAETGNHISSHEGGYPVVGLVPGADAVTISRMVFEKVPSIQWWPETGEVTPLHVPERQVFAGLSVTADDYDVMVWKDGRGRVIDSGEHRITAIAVADTMVVVARYDGSLRIVGEDLELTLPAPANALAISPDGDIAVGYGSDVTVLTQLR